MKSDTTVWQKLVEQVQQAWQEGDLYYAGELFDDLQQLSTPYLMAIAIRKGPQQHAEEYVAQTYLALLELIEKGEPIENVKGLLSTIVRRRIVDGYRQGNGVPVDSWDEAQISLGDQEAEIGWDDAIERQTAAKTLTNTILDALSVPEKDVLITRYIKERTVPQTAIALQMSEDKVKKTCQEALKRAQQIVEEQGLSYDQ